MRIPDRQSVKGFITRVTPHWLHVAYYRMYKRNPNAGKPGHMPYPTPFGRVVSRAGLHRFCREHGMLVEAERPRCSLVDDDGWLYQGVLKVGRWLSLGHLHANYTDLAVLIRKPHG